MKKHTCSLSSKIFVAALALGGFSVMAGPITSAAHPALVGASLETFNSAALGSTTSLALPDVTVSSSASFTIQTGSNGQFAPPNPSGDRYLLSNGNPITFSFSSPVSAFGFVLGAANVPQTVSVFNGANLLLGVVVIPDQVSTQPHPYVGYFGWESTSADIASFVVTSVNDVWVLDDLSYKAGSSVPETGSSLIMLASSFGGFLLLKRYRRGAK